MTPSLEDAIELAVEAHRGRRDKLGRPYILHPLRLMSRLATPAEQMAALLHDVIADSDMTIDDFRSRHYDADVVEALDRLNRRDDQTFDAFIARIAEHPVARKVKIADLADNLDLRNWSEIGEPERERLTRYRSGWETLVRADRDELAAQVGPANSSST
jgi:(p)ppGpp synthase/HD superfamily hydrolase